MNLVQAIAVGNGGCHEEVVYAVAKASVLAYVASGGQPAEKWNPWTAGHFTKSCRRGTNAQFESLRGKSISDVRYGGAEALGFVPESYDNFSEVLRKMHVAGLERQRLGWSSVHMGTSSDTSSYHSPRLYLCINPHIKMTTGKTASQVAHALFAWCLRFGFSAVHGSWMITEAEDVFDVLVDMHEGDPNSVVVIEDEGLTEFDNQMTLTVIAGVL